MKAVLEFSLAAYAWAYCWQTLIGAVLALAAALWTVRVMHRQMEAEASRHRDAQRRKLMAARAQMPDALSDLSAYIRGHASRLVGTTDTLPDEPIAAVTTLKQVIEFIDDDAAARTFELVSWYQVFRARSECRPPRPEQPQFGERMYDVSLLQTYVNSLYEYARNQSDSVDTPEPSREDLTQGLMNAFSLNHIVRHEELYAGVKAIIEHRHQHGSRGSNGCTWLQGRRWRRSHPL